MVHFLKCCRGLVLFVGLCLVLLSLNIIQIFSVLLIPFSKRSFIRFNMHAKALLARIASIACRACGNSIVVTGDQIRQESSILMANHQSFLDIPIIWMLTSPRGTAGWINWFAKDSLKYVPGLGWGLKLSQTIFLKRNWSQDAASIRATFQDLLDTQVPFMVTIFPEGTRMKPVKYAASRAYALRKQTKVFLRVLQPRPKGVWSTTQGLAAKLSAIYDVDIGYPCKPPPPLQFFTHGGYNIKVHVRRFDKSSIPTSERDFNQWMLDRYAEKDEWMLQNSGFTPT